MFTKAREVLSRHPYISGLLIAALWVLYRLSETPRQPGEKASLVLSALPIGIFIGAFRVASWRDLFRKLPYGLLSFALVGVLFATVSLRMMEAPGDSDSVNDFLNGVRNAILYGSPLVFVGEIIGWLTASKTLPSNHSVERPAAQ